MGAGNINAILRRDQQKSISAIPKEEYRIHRSTVSVPVANCSDAASSHNEYQTHEKGQPTSTIGSWG